MKWPDSTNRQLYSGGEAYESQLYLKLTFCHPGRAGDCQIINNNNNSFIYLALSLEVKTKNQVQDLQDFYRKSDLNLKTANNGIALLFYYYLKFSSKLIRILIKLYFQHSLFKRDKILKSLRPL